MRFCFSFALIVLWSACVGDVDLGAVKDPGIDTDNNNGTTPIGPVTEPFAAEVGGLAMKFLDAKGVVLTSPIRSGEISTQAPNHRYKFGMLFEITVSYSDDDGNALANQEVRLQANNATLRKLHQLTDTLAVKTDADGVARFTGLYLVDATSPVTLTAEVDGKQAGQVKKVEIEVSIDSSTPDCYATYHKDNHRNTVMGDTKSSFSACDTKHTSTASNKFVDIPSTCADNIGDMGMDIDLNLYQLDNKHKLQVRENYNGSYDAATYGDCAVMPLNLMTKRDKSATLNAYNDCNISELLAKFTPADSASLVVYDTQAGNGSCN